ncbi:MAG: PIN domain-containing protein [Bacteroidota bacterium]
MSKKDRIVLIDYENLPNIDLTKAEDDQTEIHIFVGKNQHKIPIEVVMQMQRMGSKAHWVRISGPGKNNLDFHLCFVMGQLHERKPIENQFFVLSKDKGFDSVVNFANEWGRKCYRIEEISQIENPEAIKEALKVPKRPQKVSKKLDLILEVLRKQKPQSRPRKLRTFKNFVEANFTPLVEELKIEGIIKELRAAGRVFEENGKMVYRL